MTNFPALDVAIGLSFAYFLFSVLATAITETISRFAQVRARTLERWLKAVLATSDTARAAGTYERFMETPIMKALLQSTGRKPTRRRPPAKQRPPSYIPSTHFVAAVLNAGRSATSAREEAASLSKSIEADINGLQGTIVGDSLRELYVGASGDIVRFRQDAEAWFDDQMERLSGVYRRWSQWFVWLTGAAIVLALNANTLRLAETLWNDPSKRAAIVAQAGNASASAKAKDANDAINELPVPLGWSHGYHGVGLLWASLGGLLTFAAISLGAPFWFDTLSRLARIRQTGTPPPASNAVRTGEGDQKRTPPDH